MGEHKTSGAEGGRILKVIYFNNCWFTNVGEAFIDVGGIELIRQILGEDIQLACISAMTDYYCRNAPRRNTSRFFKSSANLDLSSTFKLSNHLNADYVILPGMVGTQEYLAAPSRKMVDTLVEKGCRPIFLGLGCDKYDEKEADALRRYFEDIKPALITSRDNETFEIFKDVAPCVKGIDCALWSVDKFDPRGFVDKSYEVITFNRTIEPQELHSHQSNVVRPWHMQYSYRYEDYHDSGLISDTPMDYLTLYANAKRVYTDLVHATIVSLMYGTPVKYWRTDKRCQAFYALDDLQDNGGWLSTSEDILQKQKARIVEQAKLVMKGK